MRFPLHQGQSFCKLNKLTRYSWASCTSLGRAPGDLLEICVPMAPAASNRVAIKTEPTKLHPLFSGLTRPTGLRCDTLQYTLRSASSAPSKPTFNGTLQS